MIKAMVLVTMLSFSAPAFSMFEFGGYYGFGGLTAEGDTGSKVEDIDGSNIGGFANFTFPNVIPVINLYLGAGFYGDYIGYSKDADGIEGNLANGGAQFAVGGGLFSLTLYGRFGVGLAGGTYTAKVGTASFDFPMSGTHFHETFGLNYNVILMLNLFVEYSLNQYSMTTEDVTVSGVTVKGSDRIMNANMLRFGVKLGF